MSDDTHEMMKVDERFWSKVDRRGPDECWPWKAGKRRAGYGGFHRQGRPVSAHRVAWELANGREPAPGKVIMHSCDNPPCCNPAHLSEGTARDNMRDMVSKGRNDSRRGELHHRTHLTEKDVQDIRALAARGVRHRFIADDYGLKKAAVVDIVTKRNWTEVP